MIKANWFTWSNVIKVIIILALAWLIFDKFYSEPVDNAEKYRQEINDLQDQINDQGKTIDSLDKAFSQLDTTLIIRHETIDTTSSTDGLRGITGSLLARARR